jgi:hypothetical protein
VTFATTSPPCIADEIEIPSNARISSGQDYNLRCQRKLP